MLRRIILKLRLIWKLVEERIKSAIRNIPDFPKPGIQFKDITPLFLDPILVNDMAEKVATFYASKNADCILGIESRGFLLGPLVAQKLGIPFVMVRKKGKLPAKTISYTYDLEYGSDTIEMHEGAIKPGSKVIIHDDLLATGGTAAAAAELVKLAGAETLGFSFIIDLTFLNGTERLSAYADSHSLVQF